uniref:Interferon-related developmental regulator 1 n=1 Tax=Trifolium repens TaxID=3899 RepID=D3YBA9_TRIRP|nr:unknown [Trifolium repens]
MGKRNSRTKAAAMFDSDDDSSVTSSSTARSDLMSVSGTEDVQFDQESVLDQALDSLDEKRGSTRENAFSAIIDAFKSNMQHQFVEKKFATMLHQCLASIKKGSKKASAKEITLASHAIGCLALTVGCSDNAREIFEECITHLDESLARTTDVMKAPSLLDCLAITTFVGGNDQEETERSMDIMWRAIHPKLGSNHRILHFTYDKCAIFILKNSFSLLFVCPFVVPLFTASDCLLFSSITYLSSLLDKEDRSVRIAAGEALALIFEIGVIDKFSKEAKNANDVPQGENKPQESYIFLQGLKGKVINQCKNLSVEAGGKGSAKKDLNSQRNLFRDILDFFEDGYAPEISMKIGGDSLQTSSWSQMIQDNEFLHDVFGFSPKKKYLGNGEHRMSGGEKRLFKSPNSVLNKARTQLLNKQRILSEGRNFGHYSVNMDET